MAKLQPEFAKRNVKIIGLSVDPVTNHSKWAADIEETQGAKVNYPMIGDPQLKIAKLYGMLPAESRRHLEGRTPADNATVRTVFVIGPDKKIKLQLSYPMTTGRNFDEILRVIDSMQLTAKHKVATPVNWKPGDDVIIDGSGFERRSAAEVPRLQDHQAVSASHGAAEVAGPFLGNWSTGGEDQPSEGQTWKGTASAVPPKAEDDAALAPEGREAHPSLRSSVALFLACGSACGPVIVPVFKTGGRRAIPSPVGSTPTRFRQSSTTRRPENLPEVILARLKIRPGRVLEQTCALLAARCSWIPRNSPANDD